MSMQEDRTSVRTGDENITPAADPGLDPAASTPQEPETPAASAPDAATAGGPLVPEDAAMDFRSRWEAVQQGFVDDPRTAVTDADRLVGDVLARLSRTFEEQHHDLERQWSDGEPSTEDMRTALQRYRTFFDRLLTI
ncbi:MAG TPA: hypothetical protein VNP20_05390 [Nocardioidaceae bacterium]|nr:hypothetical protein [Nocardioidaceae bacterium]